MKSLQPYDLFVVRVNPVLVDDKVTVKEEAIQDIVRRVGTKRKLRTLLVDLVSDGREIQIHTKLVAGKDTEGSDRTSSRYRKVYIIMPIGHKVTTRTVPLVQKIIFKSCMVVVVCVRQIMHPQVIRGSIIVGKALRGDIQTCGFATGIGVKKNYIVFFHEEKRNFNWTVLYERVALDLFSFLLHFVNILILIVYQQKVRIFELTSITSTPKGSKR
ncbi:hypothetical protein K501DRAFT_270955 [Backusella circina FSU 941]|nr:hypothetical protein K501DRAFT_270955 [Backusella circina FSU 941]